MDRQELIKTGELDAFAEKATPDLVKRVTTDMTWLDAFVAEHGYDWSKVPKKAQSEAQAKVGLLNKLAFNSDYVDGGTGPIRFEITQRTVFLGNAEWNWESDKIAVPITWVSVKTRRENNSRTGDTFGIWQAWNQVDGEWRIFDAGWNRNS